MSFLFLGICMKKVWEPRTSMLKDKKFISLQSGFLERHIKWADSLIFIPTGPSLFSTKALACKWSLYERSSIRQAATETTVQLLKVFRAQLKVWLSDRVRLFKRGVFADITASCVCYYLCEVWQSVMETSAGAPVVWLGHKKVPMGKTAGLVVLLTKIKIQQQWFFFWLLVFIDFKFI